MTTPVLPGRGRGYSGRNKDIRRPGNPPAPETTVPSSAGHKNANPTPGAPPQHQQRSATYKPQNIKNQMPPVAQQPKSSNYSGTNVQNMNTGKVTQATTATGKMQNQQGYGVQNVHAVSTPVSQERALHDGGRSFMESVADENSQSVLYIEDRFAILIKQISHLNSQDDGILTNQKLQHIEGVFSKVCPQPALLRSALDAVASAAMLDAGMTSRVSLMACSVWFSRTQLLGQRLHKLFIEALTDKVDGLEVSLEGADQYLVNAVTLLTDIYSGTKLLSVEELTNLAQLIVQVLVELLDCNTPLALRTLNVQLMQYGQKLYLSVPEQLEGVSLSARKLIISRQPLAAPCRIWLSLLADQCLYRFEPLPKYLQDFYARHLDESTPDNEPRDKKFVSKPKNCDENQPDSYQSRPKQLSQVNVREPRRSLKSDSSDRWSLNSNGDPNKPGYAPDDYTKYKDDVFDGQPNDSFDSSGVSDSNISDGNNDYVSVNGGHHGERKPRPILGAGSRMTQSATVNRSEYDNNQFDFSEPPPQIQNVGEFEDPIEIPKFCASKPPPNFVPRNQHKITSASQESTDYWKSTPPPMSGNKRQESGQTPTSALSKRLDLNSWRQQANGVHDDINLDNLNIHQSYNQVMQQSLEQQDVHKNNPQNNFNIDSNPDLEWKPNENEKVVKDDGNGRWGRSYIESKEENNWEDVQGNLNQLQLDTGVSHWGKKRDSVDSGNPKDSEKSSDKEKNWIRGGVQQSRDRRGNDVGWQERRENNREKKDGEEVDSNWRRRDSEEKKDWEGKKQGNWGTRKSGEIKTTEWTNRNLPPETIEKSGRVSKEGSISRDENREEEPEDPKARRDSRGARGKRDPLEVSRKGSYWTHDDRCDRDYDG